MTVPGNVNFVRVRGYWFDQLGGGVTKPISFTPTATDLTDMGAYAYIQTDPVTVTPDAETAYFFVDLIATNDPDLTAFAWTVVREGQAPVTIAVDYASPVTDVGSGLMLQAAWLVDCATTIAPTPANTYYTSEQTDAAIATALSGISGGSAPDATASVKGLVQLAGDLGGTAASPTVPGLAGKQPSDSDLTTIAGLTPSDNDVLQRKSGAWTNRTPAQVKTDLALSASDVGLGSVNNTADTAKPVSTAQQTALNLKQDTSAKGAVSGYAGLDSSSLVPIAQLPTGSTSSTVTIGNDSRLSDARTPTAHKATHATGGSDALAPSDIGAATTAHTHAESDVTSLVSGLASKVSSVTATDATITVGGTSAAPTVGVNAIPESKVTNLVTDLAAKVTSVTAADGTVTIAGTATAPTVAVNAIAESKVTNLVSDLAGKAATSHTHVESDVTSLVSDLASKVASVTAGDSSITVAGTATAPTVAVNTITESKVTNLVTDLAGKTPRLNPTAVKTANYTAVANDFVPVDTTSGNITVTLPTAPADGTRVGVKQVIQGGTNTVAVACAGSDVLNKSGGSTSLTLTTLAQGTQLQYSATSGIWYAISSDFGLSQLDVRYAGAKGVNAQRFTTSGTWTAPSGITTVIGVLIGGGGGGGSGRRGATSTVRCGGGAGGGGGYATFTIDASVVGSSQAVVVGGAGAGGTAVSTDDTSGNPGGPGGASTFATFQATGGGGGGGGTASAGTAGSGGSGSFAGQTGGAANGSGSTGGSAGVLAAGNAATGGGGGGGMTSANGLGGGGGGGSTVFGNASGGASVGTATNGNPGVSFTGAQAGTGGSGGGAASVAAGGSGGAGGTYGGAGGGGSASLDGNLSGAGGNGAGGYVVIYSY